MRAQQLFGLSVATVLVTGALFAGSSVVFPEHAYADPPVELGSSHVLDKAGVLGGTTATVEKSLDDLYASTGIDLFVAYVPTFTDPTDAADWANTAAGLNNLGTDDYLLAVATDGRAYHLSAAADSPLTDDQLTSIERAVETPLHDDDWAGAALAASAGLSDAAAGGDGAGNANAGSGSGGNEDNPGSNSGSDTSSAGGGSGAGFVWFLILAVVVVGLIVFFVSRRQSAGRVASRGGSPGGTAGRDGPVDELAGLSLKELQRRSASTLVATDDAITTSEQELGFAVAQYGTDATGGFHKALDVAKAQLRDAFTLQQKLDDATPDTEQEQRQWRGQIIRLCEQANDALDEQTDAFDELRALEKTAPAAIARITADIKDLEPRLVQAEATLADLSGRYAAPALSTVRDNVTQARERLAFASTAESAANDKLAAGQSGPAAVALRAAEGSVQQTVVLLDAIDRLKTDLDASRQSIAAAIADLEGDVAQAKALAGAGTPGLDGVIASVGQTIADAKVALGAPILDPAATADRLETANQHIDGTLHGIRDAQQQEARTRSALGQTLLAAHSKVSAAHDFIAARRGAVGAEARTRLAEASRLAQQADSQQGSDPAAALAAAQRSGTLASQAIQFAQNDMDGFRASGDGGWGDLFGAGTAGQVRGGSRGMGGMIAGAILGGLLSGGLSGGIGGGLGGGRRRGGGMGGLGGGFGGSPRRGGGGSFGGGGRSGGRRGGGGRF